MGCIRKASETASPKKQKLYKTVNLSANEVADRKNSITGGIQCQLKEKSKHSVMLNKDTPT